MTQGQISSISQLKNRSTEEGKTITGEIDSEDPKRGREDYHSQDSRSSYHRDANMHLREVSSRPRDLRRDISDKYLSRDRSLQPARSSDRSIPAREEPPSRQSRINPNRGIPLEEVQASVPVEVFNAAVGEVRETMIQYTQCNDPTESTARKEHMRRAEEEGEMEETAALMLQATLIDPTDTLQSPEQQPTAERVPATLQLGPTVQTIQESAQDATKDTGRRKPGRPPGRRMVQGSPKLIRGSTSKKRKLQQDKPPLTRRKLIPETDQRNPQKAKSKPSSSRGS
ncbi:hypothetical protein HID58_064101 [Brassica napus]|uniref:Uncharacterized protein n=1 Tax=Brassica napus TaxID=3708 RepID=A0ABQ7Z923_BRANA|nr:hypothetical protein HID58_064101 [Brassica napus]